MELRDRIQRYGVAKCNLPELLQLLINPSPRRTDDLTAILEQLSWPDLVNLEPFELAWQYRFTSRETTILAAIGEILRQGTTSTPKTRPRISSPEDAAQLMMPRLRHLQQEHFVVLLLDTKNALIGEITVTIGSLDTSLAHPREVFKAAIRSSAASVLLLHNHPSGQEEPSPEDIQLTKQLVEAGKVLGIEVIDHVIIGDGRWCSLKEKGLL